MVKWDRFTVEHKPLAGCGDPVWVVYGWSTYPRSSVLAGQPMKQFLDSFDTHEEATAKYPEAVQSSKWAEPQVSLSHLPGEDDPVPGGMYPDDWSDRENFD